MYQNLQPLPGTVGNLLEDMGKEFSYADQVTAYTKGKIKHRERTLATCLALGGAVFSVAANAMSLPYITEKGEPTRDWAVDLIQDSIVDAVNDAEDLMDYISPSSFAARSAWGGSVETYAAWKLLDEALA